MKITSLKILVIAALCSVLVMQACKTKKIVQKTPPPGQTTPSPAPVQQPKPASVQEAPQETAPPPVKPDYNFSNIQFEFNSAVLKTSSYSLLDKAVTEMKRDNNARFMLNGHSSTEGTAEHNMALSVERANAVKLYLTNSGIDGIRITVKGFGETQPIASNDTEDGKAKNRRVEIKLM